MIIPKKLTLRELFIVGFNKRIVLHCIKIYVLKVSS